MAPRLRPPSWRGWAPDRSRRLRCGNAAPPASTQSQLRWLAPRLGQMAWRTASSLAVGWPTRTTRRSSRPSATPRRSAPAYRPSPPTEAHAQPPQQRTTCPRWPSLFGQAGAAEDPPPFSLPSARKITASAPGAQPPLSVSQMPPHDVRLVCAAAVQLACAGVATALQSVADQARAVASCISPTPQLQT